MREAHHKQDKAAENKLRQSIDAVPLRGFPFQFLTRTEKFEVNLRGRNSPLQKLMIHIDHEGLGAAEIIIRIFFRYELFNKPGIDHPRVACQVFDRHPMSRFAVAKMDCQVSVARRKLSDFFAERLNTFMQAAVYEDNSSSRHVLQSSFENAIQRRNANASCQQNERTIALLRYVEEELAAGRCDFDRRSHFDGVMQ